MSRNVTKTTKISGFIYTYSVARCKERFNYDAAALTITPSPARPIFHARYLGHCMYRDSHLFTQNNFDFVKARNVCRWNIEDCKYFVWVMTAGSRPLWHCHASSRVWHDHNPWPGVRSPPLYYPFINSFVGYIHTFVKLRRGSGNDGQGMAPKAKGLKAETRA